MPGGVLRPLSCYASPPGRALCVLDLQKSIRAGSPKEVFFCPLLRRNRSSGDLGSLVKRSSEGAWPTGRHHDWKLLRWISDFPSVAGLEMPIDSLETPTQAFRAAMYFLPVICSTRYPLLTLEAWNKTIAVNLTGVMLSVRAFRPTMRDGGAIVLLMPLADAYTASKAALVALTRLWSVDYGVSASGQTASARGRPPRK
nr:MULTISPECIES: SDR family oxidoreductase [unclassified Mesorhizobium]